VEAVAVEDLHDRVCDDDLIVDDQHFNSRLDCLRSADAVTKVVEFNKSSGDRFACMACNRSRFVRGLAGMNPDERPFDASTNTTRRNKFLFQGLG